jgi:thioredoxin-like negative regulator of GroEL
MQIPADRFAAAVDFPDYLASVTSHPELWAAVYRTARVPEEFVARARTIPGQWKLLALSEDWCGDAVNTLPVVAKFVEQLPNFELRILGRDANPELMDAHLTGTSRSIPVVMVLDEGLAEQGWWGPRPAELQAWYAREGMRLEKGERYKQARQWYARDRGRTTLDELLRIAERAAGLSLAVRSIA